MAYRRTARRSGARRTGRTAYASRRPARRVARRRGTVRRSARSGGRGSTIRIVVEQPRSATPELNALTSKVEKKAPKKAKF